MVLKMGGEMGGEREELSHYYRVIITLLLMYFDKYFDKYFNKYFLPS